MRRKPHLQAALRRKSNFNVSLWRKSHFLVALRRKLHFQVYEKLERALRALASSSGGAACPGGRGVGVSGQPRGSGGDPKVI